MRLIIGLVIFACAGLSHAAEIDAKARHDIDAGNQAWIDGMKNGTVEGIAATYAENAIDCTPAGDCFIGRPAIQEHLSARSAKAGRASSAKVTSIGSVQQGDLVFEWGRSEANLAKGQKLGGRYLTVWQKQTDGSWKILRNMSLPEDRPQ